MTELLWDSEGIGQGFSCPIVLYRALTVENYSNNSYSSIEGAFVSSELPKEGKEEEMLRYLQL